MDRIKNKRELNRRRLFSGYKLEVDVDHFSKEPKNLLLKLGREFLLKKLPFPNVYYFENGQRVKAIDVGGVRRDCISRLIESLFTQVEAGHKKLLLDVAGSPIADDQADTRDAYQTLGAILWPASGFEI